MSLPDLDDLIAEVDRTCDSAHRPGGQDQPDWPALLTVAVGISGQLQALADDLVEDYVEHCRMHGVSWADIGAALGVTRQAVQQRFHAPHKRYTPEMLAEGLQHAMTHTKRAAVQHRNNYLGTEHLLYGLTAQEEGVPDNSAVLLLRAVGASPEKIHRAVESRLGWGASRAAERIAWTPFSRKAIAIAEERATQGGSSALIDCDHLLLGLAKIGRGPAATVLSEAGISLDALDKAFVQGKSAKSAFPRTGTG